MQFGAYARQKLGHALCPFRLLILWLCTSTRDRRKSILFPRLFVIVMAICTTVMRMVLFVYASYLLYICIRHSTVMYTYVLSIPNGVEVSLASLHSTRRELHDFFDMQNPTSSDTTPFYAQHCEFTWDNIVPVVRDVYVIKHATGWFVAGMLFRNVKILFVVATSHELLEYAFKPLLPNFAECWWDSLLLDVIICNFLLGILPGAYFGIHYMYKGVGDCFLTWWMFPFAAASFLARFFLKDLLGIASTHWLNLMISSFITSYTAVCVWRFSYSDELERYVWLLIMGAILMLEVTVCVSLSLSPYGEDGGKLTKYEVEHSSIERWMPIAIVFWYIYATFAMIWCVLRIQSSVYLKKTKK